MKVAIDIHGTIDCWSLYWARAISMMNAMGIKVYIISGPERDRILGRLLALKIDTRLLSGILSVADWIKERGGAEYWYDDKGDFWTDKKTWNEAKARMCVANSIDVIIDDKLEYFHPQIAPYTLFIQFHNIKGFERIEDESTKPSDIDSTG